jgi:hypothetical protein
MPVVSHKLTPIAAEQTREYIFVTGVFAVEASVENNFEEI